MPVATPLSRAATQSPTFETLVNRAALHMGSRPYALDHGVDEQALIRYADGALSVSERDSVAGLLARCSWARKFVVGRVKKHRWKIRSAA
jgi:hypothetical protein